MSDPINIALSSKPDPVQRVINEAITILMVLGIPTEGLSPRRLERMAMAFLAVANVTSSGDWAEKLHDSSGHTLKTREIISFINAHFHEQISPGSYDDIRRKDLKLPVEAGIIVNSTSVNAARNDPTRAYGLSSEYRALIGKFGSETWEKSVSEFLQSRKTLAEILSHSRTGQVTPVILPDGTELVFSAGAHNKLQKAIIEEFLPRFGFNAEVLYVGDTADKFLFLNQDKLNALKFFEISHGELPDILAYSESRNWLYLIEAVYSSGPITPLRLHRLKMLTKGCTAEIIYVTAFPDRKTFRKFVADVAWETEVWIAEEPDHLIHFDGEKFLGSYSQK